MLEDNPLGFVISFALFILVLCFLAAGFLAKLDARRGPPTARQRYVSACWQNAICYSLIYRLRHSRRR